MLNFAHKKVRKKNKNGHNKKREDYLQRPPHEPIIMMNKSKAARFSN
jgi:hypothetical protein